MKLKSEIEQSTSGLAGSAALLLNKAKGIQYEAGEMVAFNQNKNVGIILQVDGAFGGASGGQDYVRLINDQGEIVSIKSTDINKKFDQRDQQHKVTSIDSQRNTICRDNVVKVINGPYKGHRGVIKYIHRNTVFLWDRQFKQSNGIFVENTRNIAILSEHRQQGGQNGSGNTQIAN